MELKNVKRERIHKYLEQYPNAEFHQGKTPWGVACDVALPCATQNELHLEDAKSLIANGCIAVGEGANQLPQTLFIILCTTKYCLPQEKHPTPGGLLYRA